jgi:hypothetical protein
MLLGLCLITVGNAALKADQVSLKNGDRLTGEIVQFDGKLLKLKTVYAGAVDIQWEVVEKISSEQPLYLTLNDSQMLVGPVTPSGAQVEVKTSATGAVRVNLETIRIIRSKLLLTSARPLP